MIKVLSTLTLALFAAVSFNAHAASHGGAAPMKAAAASAPASAPMKAAAASATAAAAKDMKKDEKAKK